ncbi:hypothetical protein CL614_05265 [archaeon]|nr:hypothetical protein [archaeon]
MRIKEFFRPTLGKIIIIIVLLAIFFFSLPHAYGTFIILIYLPTFLFIQFSMPNCITQVGISICATSPLTNIIAIIIAVLWSYILSCIIIAVYGGKNNFVSFLIKQINKIKNLSLKSTKGKIITTIIIVIILFLVVFQTASCPSGILPATCSEPGQVVINFPGPNIRPILYGNCDRCGSVLEKTILETYHNPIVFLIINSIIIYLIISLIDYKMYRR